MYAIVEIAGQQFKVAKDQQIFVHRLDEKEGSKVNFDRVLLIDNNGKVNVGAPVIDGASVSAKVLEHMKGDKVIVFKKKRRKGYQKTQGHRQYMTSIEITGISEKGGAKKAPPKKAEKPVAKAETKKADEKPAEKKAAPKKESKPKTVAKPAEKKAADTKKPAAKKTAAKKPAAKPKADEKKAETKKAAPKKESK